MIIELRSEATEALYSGRRRSWHCMQCQLEMQKRTLRVEHVSVCHHWTWSNGVSHVVTCACAKHSVHLTRHGAVGLPMWLPAHCAQHSMGDLSSHEALGFRKIPASRLHIS